MYIVTVFYDCQDTKRAKVFYDLYEARRFYTAKFRQGKNPSLKAKEQ